MYIAYGSTSLARSARGNRLISPICCLRTNPSEPAAAESPRTPRSPYSWLKSTAHELEIRERCRRVKARIKGSCRTSCSHQYHKQNHGSADFSYDPLSYALNFEDDVRAADGESYPSFTARLPASPEREAETTPLSVSVSRETIFQVC